MSVAAPVSNLTGGRLLARNTIWNLFGLFLPMVVGVFTVPPIVRGLGVPRFGVLSLAWVVIGYFSLFDLGIGRALTKLVADKLGERQEASIPPLMWTSMLLMLLLGIIGSVVAFAFSPWLVHRALKIPGSLQHEALLTFYLLAASIPLVTLTSGLRGFLEAQQRFRILTLIRIPMSLFSFIGPLMVLPFSHSLVPVMIVLIAGRVVACGVHLLACFSAMPALHQHLTIDRSVIKPVVTFGGWMTVTNVIGPVMVYMDRFLVGGLLSVGVVAYYSAPFDLVSRLLVIPSGLCGVLFPALAMSLAQDRQRTGVLVDGGIRYIFLAMFPIALVVVTLAPEGLRLWLGSAFAQNGSPVLRWLTAGILINSVAYIPFVMMQSLGRPDLIAILEGAQVPVYLAGLWFLTKQFGIVGTAFAWTARIVMDTLLLFYFSQRLFRYQTKFLLKLAVAMGGALTALWVASLMQNLMFKLAFLIIVLSIFVAAVWMWALEPSERTFVTGLRIGRRLRAGTSA